MNKATGALFVVKSTQSKAGLKSLENEAKILQSLNSPHIVRCMGKEFLNEADGGKEFNLFIEYMAGGNLSDMSEKFGGKLDERVVRLYTREILQGLKYLHENGIVHCDLKCKNVLVSPSGDVKLADFGCSKRANDLKTNGVSSKSVVGTPLWMAPEVLRNEGFDFSADVWSLGCTVIEMATGRPPWDHEVSNPMAMVMKIACGNGTPRFPDEFSEEGIDFLGKCLARNPRKRWNAEELLNHPFVLGLHGPSSRKEEGACSPVSILDVGICECGYESDESIDGGEFRVGIPFSSTKCCEKRKGIPWNHQLQSEFSSSENWVMVRSG